MIQQEGWEKNISAVFIGYTEGDNRGHGNSYHFNGISFGIGGDIGYYDGDSYTDIVEHLYFWWIK